MVSHPVRSWGAWALGYDWEMKDDSLAGRVAVVTGASRPHGIGAAICRALARRGAGVFLTYWLGYDREMPWGTAETLLTELRRMGTRVGAVEIDLSLPGSPDELLDTVVERLGPPSILVNNAAYSTWSDYHSLDAAVLDIHYAVNLRATALLAAGLARRLEGGSGGRIISLTSGQSLGPMVSELAYAATKGAIEALTRTLAAEVGHKGITVNAINPGPTQTGWMDEDLENELAAKFPGGRVGAPEDAARLVAFLASDEAE